jgi:hypothetical protein
VTNELVRAKVAQLLEGAKLDLANALARYAQAAAHLFQRARVAVVETEAHAQHLFLASRQLVEDLVDLLAADEVQRSLRRRNGSLRLDEVGELAVVLFADGRFEL